MKNTYNTVLQYNIYLLLTWLQLQYLHSRKLFPLPLLYTYDII